MNNKQKILTKQQLNDLANQENVASNHVVRFLSMVMEFDIGMPYAFRMLENEAQTYKLTNPTLRAIRAGIRLMS